MDDYRKKALEKLMGDMDGLESESFPKEGGDVKGVDITISVEPKVESAKEEQAEGLAEELEEIEGDDERQMLPFLRKKMGKGE